MRHHKSHRTLGRNARQRSQARSLMLNERIQTTEAKAKELRPFIEKLLTRAKKNDVPAIRHIESHVGAQARKRLCEEIAPRHEGRHGGYTRVVKLPYRESDGASMAIIEFVA